MHFQILGEEEQFESQNSVGEEEKDRRKRRRRCQWWDDERKKGSKSFQRKIYSFKGLSCGQRWTTCGWIQISIVFYLAFISQHFQIIGTFLMQIWISGFSWKIRTLLPGPAVCKTSLLHLSGTDCLELSSFFPIWTDTIIPITTHNWSHVPVTAHHYAFTVVCLLTEKCFSAYVSVESWKLYARRKVCFKKNERKHISLWKFRVFLHFQ